MTKATNTSTRFQLSDAVLLTLSLDERRRDYTKLTAVYPESSSRREHGNFCVVGPPGSGKGLWIVTQLLNWRHSVVVVDLKGETYRQTANHRRSLGQRVFVLDPRKGTPSVRAHPTSRSPWSCCAWASGGCSRIW